MSSILDQLTSRLSGDELDSLSRTIGADRNQTGTAVAAALPLLLGALQRNASRPEGAAALNDALARDHDGSVLDDLQGALGNPNLDDGRGILSHVLGNGRPQVEQRLSQASGLRDNQMGALLAALAPIVLGSLGRATRGESAERLSETLSAERSAMEANQPGIGSLLSGLLDQDGDGSVLDDLADGALGRLFGGRK